MTNEQHANGLGGKEPALAQIRDELEALPPKALLRVNVQVITAVIQFREVLGTLREHLPAMVEALRAFEPSTLDKLELYASALSVAEVDCANKGDVSSSLPALAEEGIALRGRLLAEIKALKARGLLNQKAASKLRGGNGYRHIAEDLLRLVEFLRAQGACSRPELQAADFGTNAVVDRAESIAKQLIEGQKTCRELPADAAAAALTRRRAFTLFSRAYAEMRRVVQFARFYEGDADSILPPLSTAQKGHRKKPREEPKPSPVESVSSDCATSRNVSQTTTALDAPFDPKHGDGEKGNGKPPVGFPGSDPFLD